MDEFTSQTFVKYLDVMTKGLGTGPFVTLINPTKVDKSVIQGIGIDPSKFIQFVKIIEDENMKLNRLKSRKWTVRIYTKLGEQNVCIDSDYGFVACPKNVKLEMYGGGGSMTMGIGDVVYDLVAYRYKENYDMSIISYTNRLNICRDMGFERFDRLETVQTRAVKPDTDFSSDHSLFMPLSTIHPETKHFLFKFCIICSS